MHTSHADHAEHSGTSHGNLKAYLTGFGLSIILTVIPFWMVMHPGFSRTEILASILGLAVVQILVHLVYFLHMNRSSEQRWNVVSFAFTVMVLALLVGGSVWIMYNMMAQLMAAPYVMPDQ
ncbi:MAG: cytochrome o ubiquinol oxidase subunit IV [Alphaproteobacteria bacterium]|nr:cytochrome o ubiquinol oxidase subunit IV [Alphaproteobacteria bacterium]